LLHKLGLDCSSPGFCSLDDTTLYKVTYTANASEANFAVLNAYEKVFVSDVEHPSVRNCPHAEVIPVDETGQIDLAILEDKIRSLNCEFLVSYMLANHETGIVNNLLPVAQLTRKYGGQFHTDSVQAFGRIDLHEYLPKIDPDYITLAPYKSGGMIGLAVLLHKFPLKFGWSEQRSGTINLPLVAALIKSLDLPKSSNSTLEANLDPRIVVVGQELNRLPNTTCIVCKDKDQLMMILDINRICVSTGAACTSGTSDQAHSVRAMGINHDTIRISSGWSTTTEDFMGCAEVLNKFAI